MERLVAYCGADCAECNAYKATQNNDQALREKTAVEWTKVYNFNFTPDMINCTSCTGNGVKIGHCSECDMRKCAISREVVNCGACSEFKTCEIINGFLAAFPDNKRYF
jgi:hypothetical protein